MAHPDGIHTDPKGRLFCYTPSERARRYLRINSDPDSSFKYLFDPAPLLAAPQGPSTTDLIYSATKTPITRTRSHGLTDDDVSRPVSTNPYSRPQVNPQPPLGRPSPPVIHTPSSTSSTTSRHSMADIMNPIEQRPASPVSAFDEAYGPDVNWSNNPYPAPEARAPPDSNTNLNPDTSQQQQQEQQRSMASSRASERSVGSKNPFRQNDWRYVPGDFYDHFQPLASDNGSYSWSQLDHPERQTSEVKLPLPAPFADTEDDANDYVARVSFYISIHPKKFRANAEQLYLFLQGCTGKEGRPWAAGIMRAYQKERQEMNRFPEHANLRQVVQLFRERFGILEKQRRAQAKIITIEQGTRPARNYVAAFEKLEEEAGFDDQALIQQFRRGLDAGLRKTIDNLENRPRTISAWKTIALNKDATYRADQEEESAWTVPRKSLAVPAKVNTAGSSQTTSPVRVQASSRLTDEERARLVASGGCFFCRELGHRVFECPKRNKEGDRAQGGGVGALIAQLKAMGAEERALMTEALKDF